MGCAASKLDTLDTVRRCKERCRLMKEAVYSRHHLAAAHSDYLNSLRTTGSALLTFASGEPLPVSHQSPAVLIRTPTATTTTTAAARPPTFTHHHHIPSPSIHTPPMPATSSRQQQPPPPPPPPRRRRKSRIKLPHILSDSSFTSSPPPSHNARAYSTTASQASSAWNWDNFQPPPSPPDSEYFDQLQKNKKKDDGNDTANDIHDKGSSFTSNTYIPGQIDRYRDPSSGRKEPSRAFDDSSSYSRYSYNTNGYAPRNEGQNLRRWESGGEEEETEREEVHCSEWGDHDHLSTTNSSSDEDEQEGNLKSRPCFGAMKNEAARDGNVDSASKFSSKLEEEEDGVKSANNWGDGKKEGVGSERKVMVKHKDLEEIVAAVREYFDKAASAGEHVSEMLEIGREQVDGSFKHLRKTVYHSSGMLSNLSSRWTSKPPLAVRYRYDPDSVEESGRQTSLLSTLERLLAWEKKLYQEVKTREGIKIEHEQKLSALQSQECRSGNESKLDKTKASIKRLQSLISVTSQAVSATSSAIIGLRDSDLVPQLVELCHGFMYMWRSMNQYHETQSEIVQQVRGLVNRTTKGESTSDLHRQATRDLESSLSSWHSNFCRLIKFHRNFICSLQSWLKLTLHPANTERTDGNKEPSETFSFFDEWKLGLDRIPDAVPAEAIKSFINVIHSISLKQSEELKIKKQTESASKGLERKASSLRNIEKKYYQSYSTVGIGMPDAGPDHVLDARDPLAEKKAELSTCQRRVEDEILKHSKAVEVTKAMTLNNIQTGLPGVFQAMTSFSSLMTEALEKVCARSYAV